MFISQIRFRKNGCILSVSIISIISIILILGMAKIIYAADVYNEETVAINGVIDLSKWDFCENGSLPLNGQWEYYWKQLLYPADFAQKVTNGKEYVYLPSYWTDYENDAEQRSGIGYATYRLVINTAVDTEKQLALRVPSIMTAHKLWVNGELISQDGNVATDAKESRIKYYNKVIPVHSVGERIELIIWVSNYGLPSGGVWKPLTIGHYASITDEYSRSIIIDMLIFGVLFSAGFFFVMVFYSRAQNREALYFGIFCILLSIRPLLIGNYIISKLFTSFPQEFLIRLEYVSFFLAGAVYTEFIHTLFPGAINKRFRVGVLGISLIESVFVLFAEIRVFTSINIAYRMIILIIFAYILFALYLEISKKRSDALLFLVSNGVLLLFIMNDMLYLYGVAKYGNLYSLGIISMIFIQAGLVIKRYSQAFTMVETLNEELSKKDRLKDEFLENISHELLTPVNGIVGLAEAAASLEPPGPEMKQNLALIASSGKRLTSLISNIQDLTRLKHRDIVLNIEDVDLGKVIGIITAIFRLLIDESSVRITKAHPEDLPYVKADENRLHQIFYNLVGNAVKFTPNGEIGIMAERDGQIVRITVYDTGIGIRKDDLERVFNPKERGDAAVEYPGSGLGLGITGHLVKLHGGEIHAESELGKGSKFIFTLPAGLEKDRFAANNSIQTGIEILPSQKEYGYENQAQEALPVLVVDDEPVNCLERKNGHPEKYRL